MLNVKKLLTKILSWMNSPLVVEEYSKSVTISAGNYGSLEETKTKAGYYPIGAVGANVTGTGSSAAQLVKYQIYSPSDGSCKVLIGVKNDSSSSVTWTLYIKVLWMKIA